MKFGKLLLVALFCIGVDMSSKALADDCFASYNRFLMDMESDRSNIPHAIVVNALFGSLGASTSETGAAMIPFAGGTSGAITSGGAVAAVPAVTTIGLTATRLILAEKTRKVIRLINEAEVGDGILLSEMAAKLSQKLQIPVTSEQVGAIISKGSQSQLFCPNSYDAIDGLYFWGDIQKYVQTELTK